LTKKFRCGVLGAVLLGAARLFAQEHEAHEEVPEANPGRPTVSTPATLTEVGYVQVESGGLYAAGSPEVGARFGESEVAKLTLTDRLQLLVSSEPLVHAAGVTGDSLPGSRSGEVFAGLQGVVIAGKGARPTVSVSYIRRLHESPAPEVDIGTFRQSALILCSGDLGRFHADLNGMFSEQAAGSVRRGQFGQSLSVSHPVGAYTVAGEIWHFTQPLTRGNAVGTLWAVSRALRRDVVIDAGFDHGFTSSSTQWEGFAGVTVVLPHRLWRRGGHE
jgi:hypothetical protein